MCRVQRLLTESHGHKEQDLERQCHSIWQTDWYHCQHNSPRSAAEENIDWQHQKGQDKLNIYGSGLCWQPLICSQSWYTSSESCPTKPAVSKVPSLFPRLLPALPASRKALLEHSALFHFPQSETCSPLCRGSEIICFTKSIITQQWSHKK